MLFKIFIVGITIAFFLGGLAIFNVFPDFKYMWELGGIGWIIAFIAIVLECILGKKK